MATSPKNGFKFQSIPQDEVPLGRMGKHHEIVADLLRAIDDLQDGRALKVRTSELPDSKANIRAALSRASKQKNVQLETSSDEEFLYIWKNGNGNGNGSPKK